MMNLINLATFTAILFLFISFGDSMTEAKNLEKENALFTDSSKKLATNEYRVPNWCLEEKLIMVKRDQV